MSNPTVALHGHTFRDFVWLTDTLNQNESNTGLGYYTQFGGCGNLKMFWHDNHDIKVIGDSSDAPSALVVLERDGSKTSVVQWNNLPYKQSKPWGLIGFRIQKADWHHIAYLDSILGLEPRHLDTLEGVISADICGRQEIVDIEHLLPHIDHLFMSSDAVPPCDTPMDFLTKIGKLVRGYVICHSPGGSSFSSGGPCVQILAADFHNDIDINPLGAGDYFAAAFIAGRLGGGNSVGEDVIAAHRKATNYLWEHQPWPK